jgi:hypothetical protein
MTPEYILRKSMGRKPHCSELPAEQRVRYIEYTEWSSGYAELGYDDPKKGILFNNWNYFCREVTDLLEKYGYAIEWPDEWTTCSDCGKALRTVHNSYSWQPSGFLTDDGMYCLECIDLPDYLETLEDNPRRALNDHINPEDYGYVKLEDGFESGMHPGQNANPKDIYKRLHDAGHKRLLFNVDSVGQFDITFSIWEKVSSVVSKDEVQS